MTATRPASWRRTTQMTASRRVPASRCAPQRRRRRPNLVALGRTIGVPANGAVSNVDPVPGRRLRHAPRAALRRLRRHPPARAGGAALAWDAMCSAGDVPLVGTFHTYSENAITNGAAVFTGVRRRMNRLHVRIAVSEAAAWTARRFFGGRYRDRAQRRRAPSTARPTRPRRRREGEPLRIVFVGQAVERKGLPVLLRAFEALRDHVPATLTLVGASRQEIAPHDARRRGVTRAGQGVRGGKLDALRAADVLCAPSLHGESFGMVLTEAFATGTPVVASDIPGYRDLVGHGDQGLLVPRGDALALAEGLRQMALDEKRRRAAMAAAARRAGRALRLAARRGRGGRRLRAGDRHASPGGAPAARSRARRSRAGRPAPRRTGAAPAQPGARPAARRPRAGAAGRAPAEPAGDVGRRRGARAARAAAHRRRPGRRLAGVLQARLRAASASG